MKHILTLLAALAGLAASSQAVVVLSDNFDYPNGNLVGAPGSPWAVHSGSGPVVVVNGKARLTSGSGEDVNAPLAGQPYLSTGTDMLYSSYTLVMSNMPSVGGAYIAHFRDTNTGAATGFGGRVWVSATNAVAGTTLPANTWRIGIGNGTLVNAASGQLDQDLALNTTYTIVTRFVPATGLATIWLNPTAETDPSVTATDAGTVARPNPIDVTSYGLRQNAGCGSAYIDNLRVATAFNNIAGANTSPTISPVPNQSIPANQSTPAVGFIVGDAESPAASLTVTAASANVGLVPVAKVVINNGDGTNRTVTVTPNAGQQGSALITLTVGDGVNSAETSFRVQVGAPLISAIPNQIAVSNTPIPAIPFTVVDPEGDTLNVSVESSNPTLLPAANVVVTGTGSSRTVTLTPLPNTTGLSTITLSFNDGPNTSSRSFALTVSPNLGVLFADRFPYTEFTTPNGLYGATDSPWQTVSGAAYQLQTTNGWAYLSRTNTEDVGTWLTNSLGLPATSTPAEAVVFYSSFTLRSTVLPTSSGNYFAHLKDSYNGTTFRSKLFVSTTGATAGSYRIGIANQGNTGVYFPSDCSLGSDYLVVARYNSATGETVLWVNPITEASPSLAANDAPFTSSVGAFGLRQDSGIGDLQISNLVVSTSFPFIPVPPTITITGISVSGGTVTVTFDAGASDVPANFNLVGAAVVNGPYTPTGATVTSPSAGKFQATVATSGATQFYRVKRN